jgi:hypothetical protein
MEIDPVCKSSQEVKELWKYLHERLMRQDGGYRSADGQLQAAASAPAVSGAQRVFGRRFAS